MHKSAPLMIALLLMLPAVAADWSGYHGGNEHQGRSLGVGPTTDQLKWTFDGGALAYGSPVIHPDTQHILFGNIDGELYAVDGKGKQVWKATVAGEIHGSPLVDEDGYVYVVGDKLVKFTAAGKKLWSVDVHNTGARYDGKVLVTGSPVDLGTKVAATSTDGKLYVVHKSGKVACTFTANAPSWSTPTVTRGGLLVFGTLEADADGNDAQPTIHAVTQGCKESWHLDTERSSVSTYLVGDDGSLFVSSRDYHVQKLDPATGKVLERFNTEDSITGPMALSPDGKRLYVGNIAGEVYSLKTSDLSMAWSVTVSNEIACIGGTERCLIGVATGPVVDAVGNVFFSSWWADISNGFPPNDSHQSTMYGYSASGSELWSHDLDKAVAPMLADHGVLYAAGMDGKLYAFGGNAKPTARFDITLTGLNADFDASSSADADGAVRSHAWNFGDGKTGTGEVVEHAYAKAGTYTVTLTAKDDKGATSSARITVTVKAPTGTEAPEPVTQTATSEPVAPVSTPDDHEGSNGIPAPGGLSMLVLMAALFMTRRR